MSTGRPNVRFGSKAVIPEPETAFALANVRLRPEAGIREGSPGRSVNAARQPLNAMSTPLWARWRHDDDTPAVDWGLGLYLPVVVPAARASQVGYAVLPPARKAALHADRGRHHG